MNIYDLDTPALLVDLDRTEHNIARMAGLARSGGKKLRPHTKTHKTPEIAKLQLDSGASGLTVAKLGEAEALEDAGFTDLFIANQIVGPPKIERLIALSERARVIVGIDSLAQARPLGEAAHARGREIPVRIEIDTGLGRAGVRTVDQAISLARGLNDLHGIDLEGIFTHEGHAGSQDKSHRQMASRQAARVMHEIAQAVLQAGIGLETVSVGSTPGAEFMATEDGIDELRPGVYVFYDWMQAKRGVCSYGDCALTVLTTVTSRPEETIAITDGGTKSFSGDKDPETGYGSVTDDPTVLFDWANEEHGHIRLEDSSLRPKIGQKLRIIPWHACACVNMHDTLYTVRGEKVEAEWRIAGRGRIR